MKNLLKKRLCVSLLSAGVLFAPVLYADIPVISSSFENRIFYQNTSALAVATNTSYVVHGAASVLGIPLYAGNTNGWSSQGAVIVESQLGAPMGSVFANYGLGEVLAPPPGTDASVAPVFSAENVMWIDYAQTLLAIDSGAATVKWTLSGGGTQTTVYTVSPNAKRRPVRLYWTDKQDGTPAQNAGPVIEFGSNYRVDLYPNSQITVNTGSPLDDYGFTTNRTWLSNLEQSVPDVWIAGGRLHARQDASGKFLITYSRLDASTQLRKLLAYEVVEVLAPMSAVIDQYVGDRLLPVSKQYSTDELFAEITRGAIDKSGGEDVFVYQHSSGPQKGWVWATRHTTGPAQIEIYWKAKEELDVIWPFEVDIYDTQWGGPMVQSYARAPDAARPGVPVCFAPEYTMTLMPVQLDAIGGTHASFSGNTLVSSTDGFCLLKYEADDYLWFQSVHSVTDSPIASRFWDIAEDLRPADTNRFGTWPGYIYSGDDYHEGWYNYPGSYQDDPASVASQICGVNTGELEVWWSEPKAQEGMPLPTYWPTAKEKIILDWPVRPRDITIASGLGNEGFTSTTNGMGSLSYANVYSPSEGQIARLSVANFQDTVSLDAAFTLEARIKPNSAYVSIFSKAGEFDFYITSTFYLYPSRYVDELVLRKGAALYKCSLPLDINSGEWHHVAVSYSPVEGVNFFLDGEVVGSSGVYNHSYTPQVSSLDIFTWDNGEIDEVRIWSEARSSAEIRRDIVRHVPPSAPGLELYYDFDPVRGGSASLAKDQSLNGLDTELDSRFQIVSQTIKGALPGISFSLANPHIYIQNDPLKIGYNPNEEHSLLLNDTVYALRQDLNTANTSLPYVLVEYDNPGLGRRDLMVFHVALTNEFYGFNQSLDAGLMLQAPVPLSLLAPDWTEKNKHISGPKFVDRTGRHWAVQAADNGSPTNYVYQYHYPNRADFWYPQGESHAAGELIEWVFAPSKPINYTYTVAWPADLPSLYIGDTLTNPKNGLPAIRGQLSVDVAYQQSLKTNALPSVRLIDPTVARTAPLPEIPAAMKTMRDPKTGFTFFSELPPALRSRLYYNPFAATGKELQLIGEYRERTDGHNYLMLNVLTGTNRASVLDNTLLTGIDSAWITAVAALPADAVELTNDETPFDSIALSTVGKGKGYVTLVFNNSTNENMVAESEVIGMEIIRVDDPLYVGRLDPVLSENPLDQKINLNYSADFAGQPEQYVFEWNWADPKDGMAPDPADDQAWNPYDLGTGKHYTTIGGSGVFGLSDHYLRCRYRALDPLVTAMVGTNYNEWTPPQLAEGWIKRVMKAVNPYDQRIRDYMNYELNTDLSIIQQAGAPYSGNVPLNYDALNEEGLIALYQTVLEKAKGLSIDANIEAKNSLSLALLLASGRLSDLYMVLGNEAYADALNPTIGLGLNDPLLGGDAPSIFSFQNQLPSLLDEELALLRGRDDSFNPAVSAYPVYNRLAWNITADISGGQLAYVLNYGISDVDLDGDVDVDDAKSLYPQGHGDAWGHYLAAMKGYYGLLRHDFFNWLPQVEGILAGDTEITVSFLHEKKFAVAAAAKARTGAAIVQQEARSAYKEGQANAWMNLRDDNPERAWGVAGWGSRAGQGAYFDWLTANALLPSMDSSTNHTGIQVIDRQTVAELSEISQQAMRIQLELDRADSGMNPLGLSTDVVPFDISAAEIDAGKTHFEQINDRAEKALRNAALVFEKAKTATQALRDQNEEPAFLRSVQRDEEAINRRLLEIYGYPYSDDIGPGKLYPQGYNGPDLINFSYIDISDLMDRVAGANRVISFDGSVWVQAGITNKTFELTQLDGYFDSNNASASSMAIPVWALQNFSVTWNVGPYGIPEKPASYSGSRRAEGEIQLALSDLIENVAKTFAAVETLSVESEKLEIQLLKLLNKNIYLSTVASQQSAALLQIIAKKKDVLNNEFRIQITEFASEVALNAAQAVAEGVPKIFGLSTSAGAPGSGIAYGVGAAAAAISDGIGLAFKKNIRDAEQKILDLELAMDNALGSLSDTFEIRQDLLELRRSAQDMRVTLAGLDVQLQTLESARMGFSKIIAEGDRLQVERSRVRANFAADLTQKRYRNMAYRIFQNDALARYDEAFNSAARYVYLAAKAYGYETGTLSSDSQQTSGGDFIEQIVKARALGRFSITSGQPDEPLVGGSTGDPGLADILARMQANWAVLEGRLGFNNPQTETGRFSLRQELFRIGPDGSSDENWRDTLESFRVANLFNIPEFSRYCLPFNPVLTEEPAIVIPFSTEINFRKNFFGNNLAGGDNAYDSTHFATKIRSAGVWFSNFNNTFQDGVANQPRVYLIPVGADRMRVPSVTGDEICSWNVVDQALPVPYPFTQTDWENPDWTALKDMFGGELYNIRRYPSMRAYHDSGSFDESEMISNSRLVGRSVWNTKWLLIIPGGTLLNDADEGIERFIHGRETSPDVRDENGVKDIKLLFYTYSNSGN
ncbi:MAG: LamG domain-containing protein [Kiritimatiellae bacterium]|nr:LamG domain-containing protein [Kiritimatiellia bacterium]